MQPTPWNFKERKRLESEFNALYLLLFFHLLISKQKNISLLLNSTSLVLCYSFLYKVRLAAINMLFVTKSICRTLPIQVYYSWRGIAYCIAQTVTTERMYNACVDSRDKAGAALAVCVVVGGCVVGCTVTATVVAGPVVVDVIVTIGRSSIGMLPSSRWAILPERYIRTKNHAVFILRRAIF